MTKDITEKIEFLEDLQTACAFNMAKLKPKTPAWDFVELWQREIEEELDLLEKEWDYYKEKYGE